ncbi:hypothetical protein ACVRXF_06020 [Streptococcus orisasini]
MRELEKTDMKGTLGTVTTANYLNFETQTVRADIELSWLYSYQKRET